MKFGTSEEKEAAVRPLVSLSSRRGTLSLRTGGDKKQSWGLICPHGVCLGRNSHYYSPWNSRDATGCGSRCIEATDRLRPLSSPDLPFPSRQDFLVFHGVFFFFLFFFVFSFFYIVSRIYSLNLSLPLSLFSLLCCTLDVINSSISLQIRQREFS